MDWNRDGKLDILSGCYWSSDANAGHLYVLYGEGELKFKAAERLLNEAGKPLENISISNEEYKTPEGSGRITSAICTQQFAVDFDGDGDLDLLNGCFSNEFYYFENKGTAEEPKFAAEAVLLPIKSPDYHSAPHLVDWDNDGDLDFLTGGASGGVHWSTNEGTPEKPQWSKFETLIPMSERHEQILFGDDPIKPSPATRIWACDFNRDGWQDLVVGDSTTITKPAEGISRDEFNEKEKAHQAELAKVMKKYQQISQEFSEAEEKLKDGEEVDEELSEEFEAVQEEYGSVSSKREAWCRSEMTGRVWIYLRKPPTQTRPQSN